MILDYLKEVQNFLCEIIVFMEIHLGGAAMLTVTLMLIILLIHEVRQLIKK